MLGRLVELLIDIDVPVTHLEELVRREYARAASSRARRPSGSVNRSKVAAITGLSRPEVQRLLQVLQWDAHPSAGVEPISRSARVILGWRSDPRFQLAGGLPAPLAYQGGGRSFTRLVKEYAADVPPRALLERLELLGLVSVFRRPDRKVQYLELKQFAPFKDGARHGLPALTQVLECLSIADGALAPPRLLRTEIRSPGPPSQTVVARLAVQRAEAFLEGIKESLVAGSAASTSRSAVRIVVAIAPIRQSGRPVKRANPRSRPRN